MVPLSKSGLTYESRQQSWHGVGLHMLLVLRGRPFDNSFAKNGIFGDSCKVTVHVNIGFPYSPPSPKLAS
jgi:hypothetical protein